MTGHTHVGNGFVIENNICKGERIKFCPEINGQVGHFVLDIFQKNPNHVGQIEAESGKTTTYAEMSEKSVRCALWLMEQNVKSHDVIALCCDCRADAYIPFLSTFYIGATHNPWDNEVTTTTARRLMQLTQPKIMFCMESNVGTLEEAAKLEGISVKFVVLEKSDKYECLDNVLKSKTADDIKNFKPKVISDLQDYALIMFSSGSTGFPKGVVHTYQSLISNFFCQVTRFPVEKSVNLWYSTPYWITSTMYTIKSIMEKSVRIIHKNFHPEETAKYIERYKINFCALNATALVYLHKSGILSSKKYCLDSLRVVMVGGAKVNAQVFHDVRNNLPNGRLYNVFGSTETGPITCCQTSECKSANSIGFVCPEVEQKVIDEDGKALGPNEPGELVIRRPVFMLGYYKNPEETSKAIDDEGWFHTGDKAMYTENGEFHFIERIKFLMKYRGHQVSPSEIEDLLSRHPAVMEVAVLPLPHEIDGDRPLAFVKKNPGSEVTEDELIKLSCKLGRNKRLSGGVVFLEDMPHTASGKIAKPELKLLLQKLIETNKIDLNKAT